MAFREDSGFDESRDLSAEEVELVERLNQRRVIDIVRGLVQEIPGIRDINDSGFEEYQTPHRIYPLFNRIEHDVMNYHYLRGQREIMLRADGNVPELYIARLQNRIRNCVENVNANYATLIGEYPVAMNEAINNRFSVHTLINRMQMIQRLVRYVPQNDQLIFRF